jgi:hypothetical protein
MLHLKKLCVRYATEPEDSHLNAGAANFCPVLHALETICLKTHGAPSGASLHVLARWTQIPAGATLDLSHCRLPVPAHLAINGWGRGWLPAVLACKSACVAGCVVVAADNSDIDHYLSAVASMSPGHYQDSSHTLLLGRHVTPGGFSRLLSCAQQPPLRLQLRRLEHAQQGQYVLDWYGSLRLAHPHLAALVGAAAPRLVSLMVADCGLLSNLDAAVLAGACHALKEVQLLGASLLGDPALHSLAAGCRQLERVQLTHARVTEQGVVVALAMMQGLQRLELGAASVERLEGLKALVQQQLGAAGCLQWVVEGPSAVGVSDAPAASITWKRALGGRGAVGSC